jgi:N-acetylated-alpha-linked acidic dipeptidase
MAAAAGSDQPSSKADEPAGQKSPPAPLRFSPRASPWELQAEAHALAVPTPENARTWLRILTAEPHVAGTEADYKTAVFVRDKLREWGWKAEIAELEVLLNYPSQRSSLSVVRPIEKDISLEEAPISTDKDSASTAAFGAFHGYGPSGMAVGQVVYANYGRPEDYEALEKLGIEIKGKIVLTRYGSLFRGLKVREAQKRGAKGILIYSDPADDGYAKGDLYPNGRFRPPSAIQRGSVQFLSLGPGDPSTPFGASTKGAKRIPIDAEYGLSKDEAWQKETGLKRADFYATIPSLPLSYEGAHEVLKLLAGPNVPSGWQGGLPLPYHVGPGPIEVSLRVSMEYKLRKIWNVIASITGSEEPFRWVLLGNHRDAWVYGAVDPGSGTAATLETCRALGAAVKNGWKPRRTLMYASWDAEEYGLVGSTEWAEEHKAELDWMALLVLNVDSAVSGPELEMGGVPSLRDLALNAAESLNDPRTGRSLRAIWTEGRRNAWAAGAPLVLADPAWERHPSEGNSASSGVPQTAPSHDFFPQIGWLGSGSDYTVFVDHLGVPALDAGFKGGYGVYHSIYDNFNWMEKFGDPEFSTHALAARLYTLIVMRAAAAEVAPLLFASYGQALRQHVDELRLIHARQVRKAGSSTSAGHCEIEGLERLIDAVLEFQREAEALDRETAAVAAGDAPRREQLVDLNDALQRVERALLVEKGLPGRPWFKHAIYAPGLTTGYACWPMPAIRQAIEEKSADALRLAVHMTVERIQSATAAIGLARKRAQLARASR